MLQGRIEAAVAHLTGGEPRFQVKTPQATLGVRGTDFRVAAQPETGTSWGEVLTGRVDVTGSTAPFKAGVAKVVSLKAGQGALIDAQRRVGAPIALPQPPDLRGLPALHERPVVTLNVPPVTGASLYRAQAAVDAEFTQVLAEATSPTPTLRLRDLPDGPYHLRVRVAQAQGLEGPDAKGTFVLKARPEPPNMVNPAPKAKHRGLDIPCNGPNRPEPAAIACRSSVRMASGPAPWWTRRSPRPPGARACHRAATVGAWPAFAPTEMPGRSAMLRDSR